MYRDNNRDNNRESIVSCGVRAVVLLEVEGECKRKER